jgi:hypothetical protein
MLILYYLVAFMLIKRLGVLLGFVRLLCYAETYFFDLSNLATIFLELSLKNRLLSLPETWRDLRTTLNISLY